MSTLLVKNATLIATMDEQGRELADSALFCRDGFIEQIGRSRELPSEADEVLDLRDHIVLPVTHMQMLWSRACLAQALRFVDAGAFDHGAAPD